MEYTLDEILILINNLDKREALRKYGPKHSVVVVNQQLQVESVTRYKYTPKTSETNVLLGQYKGSCYFLASPGRFETTEKLQARIDHCINAFTVDEHENKLKNKGEKVNYPYELDGISVRGRSD